MASARDSYNQGLDFMTRGDYTRAVAAFSEAIRLEPTYPDYYNKRGDAYLEIGDFAKSCADYDQANQIRTS
jgi:Flp pilus assembly protein TadD